MVDIHRTSPLTEDNWLPVIPYVSRTRLSPLAEKCLSPTQTGCLVSKLGAWADLGIGEVGCGGCMAATPCVGRPHHGSSRWGLSESLKQVRLPCLPPNSQQPLTSRINRPLPILLSSRVYSEIVFRCRKGEPTCHHHCSCPQLTQDWDSRLGWRQQR